MFVYQTKIHMYTVYVYIYIYIFVLDDVHVMFKVFMAASCHWSSYKAGVWRISKNLPL